MLVQERILNPRKKNNITGTTFHLIFLDNKKISLFDNSWDLPVFYGTSGQLTATLHNKGGFGNIEFQSGIPYSKTIIKIIMYKANESEIFKPIGTPLEGFPKDIIIPNH